MGQCQKGNTGAVDSSGAIGVSQGPGRRSGPMLPGEFASSTPFLDILMLKALLHKQSERQMLHEQSHRQM